MHILYYLELRITKGKFERSIVFVFFSWSMCKFNFLYIKVAETNYLCFPVESSKCCPFQAVIVRAEFPFWIHWLLLWQKLVMTGLWMHVSHWPTWKKWFLLLLLMFVAVLCPVLGWLKKYLFHCRCIYILLAYV